jgi:hypothetical protein
MESAEYLTTLCPLCEGSIEFPARGLGEAVECPHCHKFIVLGSVTAPVQKEKAPSVVEHPPAASPPIQPKGSRSKRQMKTTASLPWHEQTVNDDKNNQPPFSGPGGFIAAAILLFLLLLGLERVLNAVGFTILGQ